MTRITTEEVCKVMLRFFTMMIFFLIASFFFSTSSQGQTLPTRFNLKEFNRVTPPKKQSWGTCWTFATMASIESNYLTKNKGATINLSEYHMDKFSGFTRKGHSSHYRPGEWYSGQGEKYPGSNVDDLNSGLIVHLGGDYKMASAYLAFRGGAVHESGDSLIGSDHRGHQHFGNGPKEGILEYSNQKSFFPTSIEWLTHGTYSENIERIKISILQDGSVASNQFMEDDPHSELYSKEIHYYHGDQAPNHALNIIGWDESITLAPLLPGAWIVQDSDHKNQKGEHLSYFYIPYADKYTGQHPTMGGVIFKDIQKAKFTKILSHSLHGWQHDFSLVGLKKISNRHTLDKPMNITGVGFFTVLPNEEVQIIIHNEIQKKDCFMKKKTFKNPGFSYFHFNCPNQQGPIRITQKNRSQIYALDATNVFQTLLSNSEYQMPKEGESILVKSKSSPGESFYFQGEWKDLYNVQWGNEKKHGVIFTKNKSANFPLYLYLK